MNAYQLPEALHADWRNFAVCRGSEDLMFATSAADVQHAKSLCWSCPSMEACGQWALERGEEWGVWGGLSEGDRRRMRRRKRAAA